MKQDRDKPQTPVDLDVFCPLPWMHLALMANGAVRPCCANRENLKSNQHEDLNSRFHSEQMHNLRQSMLKGIRPKSCQSCYQDEKWGHKSRRILALKHMHRVDFEKPKIKYLEMALENTCNLKCRTCSSFFSTKWNKEEQLLDPNDPPTSAHRFELKDLSLDYSQLEVVRLVGGEPLMFKEHVQLLENLKPYAHKIRLDYNTNLTVLPDEILEYWLDYERILVTVSLDALGPLNDYIRSGSQFERVILNLKRLLERFKQARKDQAYVTIHTTVSIYNAHILPEFDDYFLKQFPEVPLTKKCVILPHRLSIRNLPKAYKKKLNQLYDSQAKSVYRHQYDYIRDFLNQPPTTDFEETLAWNQKLDELRNIPPIYQDLFTRLWTATDSE